MSFVVDPRGSGVRTGQLGKVALVVHLRQQSAGADSGLATGRLPIRPAAVVV
ncbi:hypothetical protein [Arthrobacter methylotrophus]|uniref:Uncharacterized protein n=1 Tax=Arthrobacter methylotrophus TaxID=121291 RepID=A0ABV5UVC3_9MICC